MGLRVMCWRGNTSTMIEGVALTPCITVQTQSTIQFHTLLTLSCEKDSEILEAATRSQLLFLSVHTILT